MNELKWLTIVGIIYIFLYIIPAAVLPLVFNVQNREFLNSLLFVLVDGWYILLIGVVDILFGHFGKSNSKIKKYGKYVLIASVALLLIGLVSALHTILSALRPK